MPGIKVRDGEPIDKVLRIFKKQVEKAGVIGDLKKNQHYEKPSVKRKKKAIAARKLSVLEDVAWTAARKASQDAPAALREIVVSVMQQSLALLFSEERMHRLCAVATQSRWPVVEQFIHDLRGALRHIVIEGQNAGSFAPGDPDRIAGALFSALTKVWHPAMLETYQGDDLLAQAEALTDLLLRGLTVK